MVASISPQELHRRQAEGQTGELIDVRTPLEFRAVHAVSARNVPLDRLDPERLSSQDRLDADPVYVICKSGGRGAKAAKLLSEAGHTNVWNVEGGTDAWASEGLPVTRGKQSMSLERQVRIVAGLLVFVSALAGILVHPYLAGLAVAVGAGLTFAGITDSCAMGMLLARMPWNQMTCSSSDEIEACSIATNSEPRSS